MLKSSFTKTNSNYWIYGEIEKILSVTEIILANNNPN